MQVELEIEQPIKVQEGTFDHLIQEEEQDVVEEQEEIPQEQQQYNLARDRQRKQIKLPKRFSQAYIVYFALLVAQDIETQDPLTYYEVISSDESAEWIVSMSGEMKPLHKNQMGVSQTTQRTEDHWLQMGLQEK